MNYLFCDIILYAIGDRRRRSCSCIWYCSCSRLAVIPVIGIRLCCCGETVPVVFVCIFSLLFIGFNL